MGAELTPFEPDDEYLIDTIDKLRAVSNPLRMQILNALMSAARTVKEVGDLLGTKSNTLYYHVGELESAGMIVLVDAVVKSGIQLKYYRASARYYRLQSSLLYTNGELSERRAGADFVVGAVLGAAHDLRESLESGTANEHPECLRVSQRTIRTTEEQAAALRERVESLEREFAAADRAGAPLRIQLQYAFFPIADDAQQSSTKRQAAGKDGRQR